MEKRIEEFFARAPKVSLTADEKSAGREMLRSFMALRPVRSVAASPMLAGFRRFYFGQAGKSAAVFATVLGLLLASAGVSYAAESAIPGDVLYPIKVGVNEEIRAALVVSTRDKADWEAERAERRLAEVETLASQGRLKAANSADLAARFHVHAAGVKRGMAELRAGADADVADDVGARLEGTLQAHKKILAVLRRDAVIASRRAEESQDGGKSVRAGGDVGGEREEGRRSLAAIAATVDAEASATAQERERAVDNAAKEKNAERTKENLRARHDAAEKKINGARAFLVEMRARLDQSAAAQAESRLTAAEGFVVEADAKAAAGDARAAFGLYLKAQRGAQEVKPLIRAKNGLRLKLDLGIGAGRDGGIRDGGTGQSAPRLDSARDQQEGKESPSRQEVRRDPPDEGSPQAEDRPGRQDDARGGIDLRVGADGEFRLR